jgi:hypothetical protein
MSVAQLARAFGWTMQEVRAHTLRDVRAMADVLRAEQRAQRMARARRR